MKLRFTLLFAILVGAVALAASIITRPREAKTEQRGPVSPDALGLALQADRIERERSMTGYAATDNDRLRERYTADEAARRTAEIEREQQIWQPDRITTCRVDGKGTEPTICVERVGPRERRLGDLVTLRLTWHNLPAGAYVRLWVRNGASAGERWQYAGPNGAIVPDFAASASSGTTVLRWDGKSVWCAPSDLPMLCDVGEVGQYVVRAAILTGTDPFWPSWPAQSPTPARWLALSETAPIVFGGEPRVFEKVPTSTSGPVNDALRSLVPESYLVQSSLQQPKARLAGWRVGWISRCQTIILGAPYSGKPQLCFPNSRLDRFGLKLRPWDVFAQGKVGIAHGVMPPGEARERAQIAAFRRVADVARYITYREATKAAPQGSHPNTDDPDIQRRNHAVTWTSQSQVYAYFHLERGRPFWVVTLDQAVKTVNYEEYVRGTERLTYRVDYDGRVCLLQAGGGLSDESEHRCP